jgi:type II secretory pathway component PulM
MSNPLHERIRDLEQTLKEERRVLAESQERYNELERKYQDLLLRDLS